MMYDNWKFIKTEMAELIYQISFRLIFCLFFISLNYKSMLSFSYVCKIENAWLHGSAKNVIFCTK